MFTLFPFRLRPPVDFKVQRLKNRDNRNCYCPWISQCRLINRTTFFDQRMETSLRFLLPADVQFIGKWFHNVQVTSCLEIQHHLNFLLSRPEIEFSKLIATDEWRISTVNKIYDCCSTYSGSLVVPKVITDEQIAESAKFRELGRFPLLSYKHENGAVMMKSSQPSSIHTKRCRADEAILNCLLGKSQKGFIVDTWGGGKNSSKCTSENDQNYRQLIYLLNHELIASYKLF